MDTIKSLKPNMSARKAALWEQLSKSSRRRVMKSYGFELFHWKTIAPFSSLSGALEKVLYALFMATSPHTLEEIEYLLIARWYSNTDINTIRARVATLAMDGLISDKGNGRYAITTAGRERLADITKFWQDSQQTKYKKQRKQVKRGADYVSYRRQGGAKK